MNPTRIVNDTRYFYFTIRRLFMNTRRLLINSRRISTKSRRIFHFGKHTDKQEFTKCVFAEYETR